MTERIRRQQGVPRLWGSGEVAQAAARTAALVYDAIESARLTPGGRTAAITIAVQRGLLKEEDEVIMAIRHLKRGGNPDRVTDGLDQALELALRFAHREGEPYLKEYKKLVTQKIIALEEAGLFGQAADFAVSEGIAFKGAKLRELHELLGEPLTNGRPIESLGVEHGPGLSENVGIGREDSRRS